MPPSWKNGDGRSYSDILAKGILNSFVLALSATLTLLFLIGSYDYFRNVEDNKCEMTYMFEYPEFIVSTGKSEYLIWYKLKILIIFSASNLTRKWIKSTPSMDCMLMLKGNMWGLQSDTSFRGSLFFLCLGMLVPISKVCSHVM